MSPGQRIDDRYLLEACVGQGGMGVVYRARDLAEGRLVALKIVQVADASQRQRFEREASVLRELDHEAIARYYAHGRLGRGAHYLAMEWIEGPTLRDRIRRGPLSLEEALRLAPRLAEALGAAHAAGVVHRDVKPANVMLPGDDLAAAKLLDFGVARRARLGEATLTEPGVFMGTLSYMAPEQARDAKTVDARADVYALGAVIFECLAGQAAIAEEEPVRVLAKIVLEPTPRLRERRPDMSVAIDALLATMMAKSPAERPADGRAVRALIEEVSSSAGELGRRSGISGSERRLSWVMLIAERGIDEAEAEDGSLAAIVAGHGGELQRLVDGCGLVTFPSGAHETWRAARTALAWRARHPASRIALAAGPGVHAIGDGSAPQIGEVIDRAVRELERTAPGVIRLEPAARRLLERDFIVSDDELRDDRRADETVLPVLGRFPPLVGRRRELAALTALLDECLEEGAARAVLLKGEGGMGKSRLVRELAGRAQREHGWTVARGRVDAAQAGIPFAVVADLVRAMAGILRHDTVDAARDKLLRRVARNVPPGDRQRVATYLGELASISVDSSPSGVARPDAQVLGDAIRVAVEDFFAAEVATAPLLLILDDLQWADAPSLRLVQAVLRHLAERPLAVVLSGRPAMEERFSEIWRAIGPDVVAVGALSGKASCELLRVILGERPEAADLAAKSGGVPLFIEELARAAARGDRDLPDTILGAVQARLDAIDGDARLVLRAASVFGRRFWLGGVAALVEPMATPLARCLLELEGREIIARSRATSLESEQEYLFVHDFVRDGAYAMLPEEDRRRGHALAGAWLERAGLRDAEVIAKHYQYGGLAAEALPWMMKAAQQALDGNDFERALAGAEAAMKAHGDRVAMLLVRAEASRHLGRHRDAMGLARRALSLAVNGSKRWFKAARELAASAAQAEAHHIVEWVGGEVGEAPSTAENATEKVSALCMVAWTLQLSGRLALAHELVVKATRLCDAASIDDPLPRAYLCGVQAARAYGAGDLATYLRESERSADFFSAAGHQRLGCGQALNVTVGYIGVGCYDRASEVATRVLATARRLGLRAQECFALCLLSNALLELGDMEGAHRGAAEAWAIAHERQQARHLGLSEMLLGRIASARGDHDAAFERLTSALGHFESSPSYRVHTLGVIADAHLRQGQPKQALEVAERAHQLADSIGVAGASRGHLALVRAEALIALKRPGEAASVVREASRALLARADGFDDPWVRDRFLRGIAAHARLLALGRALSDVTEPMDDSR